MSIRDVLLPQRLDQQYRGNRAGLWLFGFVVTMKSLQSLAVILNGRSTLPGADGIPLASYTPEAAQAVVSGFALGSLWRLFFCLVGWIVLLRYRSAVPSMFVLFACNYLAAQVLLQVVPLPHVGTPVGIFVNLGLFVVMLFGLGLSVRPRRE